MTAGVYKSILEFILGDRHGEVKDSYDRGTHCGTWKDCKKARKLFLLRKVGKKIIAKAIPKLGIFNENSVVLVRNMT